jgi:hypothetical protein
MPTTRPRRSRLRTAALVAAGLLGIIILALLGFIAPVFTSYSEAFDTETVLNQTFPSQATFTPPSDGTIPQDRMRRFIAVRKVLIPRCGSVTEIQQALARVVQRHDKGPKAAEGLLVDVTRALWTMPRVGRDFGDYVAERNRALVANGIGLGEYTWIYVIAYVSWLGERPERVIESPDKPRLFEDRVYRQVADMIRRHVADVTAMAGKAGDGLSGASSASLDPWRAAIRVVPEGGPPVPFNGHLPPELEESLAPFHAELIRVSCVAAAELDVVVTERRGPWFDHR